MTRIQLNVTTMKTTRDYSPVPLERWQNDQWEVPVQSRPLANSRGWRIIELVCHFARPEDICVLQGRDRTPLHRHARRRTPRWPRRLRLQQLTLTGGCL